MTWLADAHREWHYVHGAPGQSDEVCPLDCYDPPEDHDPEWEDEELPLEPETEEILLALYG
jgi:hypothetical protein